MRGFTIPTIYTAVDKFTSRVRNMININNAFGASAARTERAFRSARNASDDLFNRFTGGYGTMAIAGGFGLATIAVNKFVNEASTIEDAVARFTPILGTVDKANEFVRKLNKEAASTPFQFDQISDAAGSLLPALKGNMDVAIKMWRMIGDTSGGNAAKMETITRGVNKALLKGKVDMESLNMIAEAGVPIHGALAKQMGFAENQMDLYFKAVSAGKVPTDKLISTFDQMTSKGGMFFNGMAIASQTFTGKLSSMLDNINLSAGAIGTAMLPVMKEYADKVSDTAAKVMEWAQNNQDLIKTKVERFVNKVASTLNFLRENFDTIVTITKVYIGALVGLKVISVASSVAIHAMSAAAFLYNIAIGITGALTGKANVNIGKSAVAMAAYKVTTAATTAVQWLWNAAMTVGSFALTGLGVAKQAIVMGAYKIALGAVTAAQWLWNAAMTANPVGLIIVGVAALIGLVAAIITKWNDWGAALSIFLGPLGLVISLVQSFRRNWDMIVEAFKTGGILAGLKAIGSTILDAVLMPLQQILGIVAKLTGFDWAEKAVKDIEKFREKLGVKTTTDESDQPAGARGSSTAPVLNTRAAQQESLNQQIIKTNNARADIYLHDPGRFVREAKSDHEFTQFNISSTMRGW